MKILTDITITIFILPILLVVIPIIYFSILISDGSPAIYKQERVGKNGKIFVLYKFRTMDQSSDENIHEEHYKNLSKEEAVEPSLKPGNPIRIENDDRITKIGGFLRKTSLDELPNLFNVLFGEMSIVGPRPLFPEDNSFYDKQYIRRLNVLPGITGLLQINDRNTDDFETWFKYDLEYIENWSIYLDLKIIIYTPFSLLKKKTQGK